MADRQFQIPQHGNKLPDFRRECFRQRGSAQQQDIDIRQRVQLPATVTADCHQGEIRHLIKTEKLPQADQQLIDIITAGQQQGMNRLAFAESLCLPAAVMLQVFPQHRQLQIIISKG